jgi:hypothetical protein
METEMTTATATAGVLTPYTVPAEGCLCSAGREEIPAGAAAFADADGWIVCGGCAAHCTSCTDPDCDHPRYAGPDEVDAATEAAPANRPDSGLISDSAAGGTECAADGEDWPCRAWLRQHEGWRDEPGIPRFGADEYDG